MSPLILVNALNLCTLQSFHSLTLHPSQILSYPVLPFYSGFSYHTCNIYCTVLYPHALRSATFDHFQHSTINFFTLARHAELSTYAVFITHSVRHTDNSALLPGSYTYRFHSMSMPLLPIFVSVQICHHLKPSYLYAYCPSFFLHALRILLLSSLGKLSRIPRSIPTCFYKM